MKVVLIIDSFKGCLSSKAVEETAAAAICERFPQAEVCCVPIADGGEGMLEVLVEATGGKKMAVAAHDALMRPIVAHYGVLGDGETAVVEMAQASGLPGLAPEERNPMVTTTFGTGEILREVIAAGYRHVVMGIGGSATNDAGMGMMQALGARFKDVGGKDLPVGCGKLLNRVDKIDLKDFRRCLEGVDFVTACDVCNPFCGPDGAAEVFAPQKGATPSMVRALDEGLVHFSEKIKECTGQDVTLLPGAGAAGGMGGALSAFFGAELRSGISLVLEQMHIEELAKGASFIVTGEGKADVQTLMGKVSAGILEVGKKLGVNVALLAGAVEDRERLLDAGFSEVMAVTPQGQPLSEAMQEEVAKENIRKAIFRVIR